MAICVRVQGLNSAMLYAFLRLWGKATVLKHEIKASMKHLSWLLMGFGKWSFVLQNLYLQCEDGPVSTVPLKWCMEHILYSEWLFYWSSMILEVDMYGT